MRDLESRKQEAENLRNIIQVYKEMSADKTLVPSEEHCQSVLRMADEATIKEEILVDAFALGQTFEVELGVLKKQGFNTNSPQAVTRIALIYQAIMLLYYCMATMNGVREMMSPKAIIHNIGLREFRSVAALVSRSDIRGALWSILVAQHFDVKKGMRVGRAVKHPKRDLMARYRVTQLPIYSAMLRETDRKRLLSDADELRKKISAKDATKAVAGLFTYTGIK